MVRIPPKPRPSPGARRRQQGFTLLEVLVALGILALSFGVLLKVFTGALTNAEVADGAGRAAAMAESLMAGVGTAFPLEDGGASGRLDGGGAWRVTITPRPEDDGPLAPYVLYEVTVAVDWSAGARDRATVLRSLRVGGRVE